MMNPNLTSYVNSGGKAFITGYDSIASPTHPDLISFLGGTTSNDGGNPTTTVNSSNSLTTGVIDIRNLAVPVFNDHDDVCAPLLAGTIGVTPSSGGCAGAGFVWTLRMLGSGMVAYVSTSNNGFTNLPDWTDTTIPGDGVYNGGLRNFAYNACPPSASSVSPATAAPALNEWGMIIFAALAGLASVVYLRRKKERV